jgi:tRNA A-37 threonylcarbamoyl transferase component Bud32
MKQNEERETRNKLKKTEICTPNLYAIKDHHLVEEFVEGTNLYEWSHSSNLKSACVCARACRIVYKVGCLTGRLHENNWAFIDNKAQNYLITEHEKIYRVDTEFLQKKCDNFQKYMDVGTFLGSLLDLQRSKYECLLQSFLDGYSKTTGKDVSLKAFLVRNMVSLLLAPKYSNTIPNMWIGPKRE